MAKKKSGLSSKDVTEKLKELELQMKRLGNLYNQYLSGQRKRPPNHEQMKVERMIRTFIQEPIQNVGLRFRFLNLSATYNTMKTLWNRKAEEMLSGGKSRASSRVQRFSKKRVARFMGSGRSSRDSFTRRRPGRKTAQETKEKAAPEKTADQQPETAAPAESKTPATAAAQARPRSGGGIDRLFQSLTDHQKSRGQAPTFQSPDQLRRYLAQQKAKIQKQTGVQNIQLKVRLEGGKLKIKAKRRGA